MKSDVNILAEVSKLKEKNGRYLSKREQQIMEIIYRQGSITASELEALLPGKPANSTVRTLLRILEEKGQLRHEKVEGRFVFSPIQTGGDAAKQELGKVVDTFFKGSVSQTLAALLDENEKLTPDEFSELERLIKKAKEEGR